MCETQRNNYDVMKTGLKKYSISFFDEGAAGDYTLLVEAGICRGDAELARVSFNYNG